MDDEDERILSALKTGDLIHFKGTIKDIVMRSINIEPAVLGRHVTKVGVESAPLPTDERLPASAAKEADKPAEPAAPTAAAAPTPSFNCAKAFTTVEKLICSDAELAELDSSLAKIYEARQGSASASEKEALRESQLNWMKNARNLCKDVACVHGEYHEQIKYLKN